jgi:transposase
MPIIRQGSLFNMQDLYEIEPMKQFEAIFSTLHIETFLFAFTKKRYMTLLRNLII